MDSARGKRSRTEDSKKGAESGTESEEQLLTPVRSLMSIDLPQCLRDITKVGERGEGRRKIESNV